MTTAGEIAYLREHVQYQVVMVRWAFGQIQPLPPSLERNAFIECFAVHARALFEFLASKGDTRSVNALVYVEGFKTDGSADASRKINTRNQIGGQLPGEPVSWFSPNFPGLCLTHRDSARVLLWVGVPQEGDMDTTTLLIIILVVLILFGGGWYGRGRWF